MRKEITKEKIDEIFKELRTRFDEKIKKKGNLGFADKHSAFGHLTEEYNELLWELQKNRHKEFDEETYDVIIVCLVSLLSY